MHVRTVLALLGVFFTAAFAESWDDTLVVSDEAMQENDTLILSPSVNDSTRVYGLLGTVFVEQGATLILRAGTVIKAAGYNPALDKAEQGSSVLFTPASLVICRGANLIVEGTQDSPVVFTSVWDDLDDPSDIPQHVRGLWGGIVLLGSAPVNTSDTTDSVATLNADDTRLHYGGGDEQDGSGNIRYLSIRYAGYPHSKFSPQSGLLMAGVGHGTVVEYVDVYNSYGPGITIAGGSVNGTYLVSAFSAKKAFHLDKGWRGRGQYWFAMMRNDEEDIHSTKKVSPEYIVEHSSGDNPPDEAQRTTLPVIANATFLGSGHGLDIYSSNGLFNFRDGYGTYMNSIFAETGDGIENAKPDALRNNELTFSTNLFTNICTEYCTLYVDFWNSPNPFEDDGNPILDPNSVVGDNLELNDSLVAWANDYAHPVFLFPYDTTGVIPSNIRDSKSEPGPKGQTAGRFDLRPLSRIARDSCASQALIAQLDSTGFIEYTTYKGAFDPYAHGTWLAGWTTFARYDCLADTLVQAPAAHPLENYQDFEPDEVSIQKSDVQTGMQTPRLIAAAQRDGMRLFWPGRRHETYRVSLFDIRGRLQTIVQYTATTNGMQSFTFGKTAMTNGCTVVTVQSVSDPNSPAHRHTVVPLR